jgi:hypothetical protein
VGVHVEWVDAASANVAYAQSGEIEDSYGTENERPALVLYADDAVVIEGTPAELRTLVERMMHQLPH